MCSNAEVTKAAGFLDNLPFVWSGYARDLAFYRLGRGLEAAV